MSTPIRCPQSIAPTVLITGAAGNLGSHLARRLRSEPVKLRLMTHRTPLPDDLSADAGIEVVRADLSRPETLTTALKGADCVVHFAGVLFRPRPATFLPETNTRWFANLLDVAMATGVRRVILISFPHVEGPTTWMSHPLLNLGGGRTPFWATLSCRSIFS